MPIDLCDDVTVEVRRTNRGGPPTIALSVDDATVPNDATNLAVRAVEAVCAERNLGGMITVSLTKRIPSGAGLGGGSGNAATILRGLSQLLELDIDGEHLHALALRLGADVPFFLTGRPARIRGVGEHIELLSRWPRMTLVVAVPSVAVTTPWAFARYREAMPVVEATGETEAAAMAAGVPPTAALLVNDLERVVLPAFPAIAELKEQLRAAGATAAVMSGSGSAVVGIAPSDAAAARIAATVRRLVPGCAIHVTDVPAVG